MLTATCFKDALLDGAREVFETMVFMALAESEQNGPEIGEMALLGSITFKGDLEGCLTICCGATCARTIAANMLGMDTSEELGEMGLSANQQILYTQYEVTVGPHPSFMCAAVFPMAVLASFGGTGLEHVGEGPAQEQPASEPPSAPVPKASSPSGIAKPDGPGGGPKPDVGAQPQSVRPAAVTEGPPVAPPSLVTLSVKVKWIMSRPVRTIRPDTSLEAMIECMRRYGGRCLPVADEKGIVKGMVTVFDILMCILASNKDLSWKGGPPQAPALLL